MTNFKINLLFGVVAVAVSLIIAYYSQIHHHLLERANIPILSASIFPPTVTDFTRNIRFIGSRTPGVEHFQNVFYAEEPTGQRRFAPPVPVSPPKGSIIDASKPGAWCPQGVGDILPFTSQVNNISENCLSLRIARPSGVQRDAKLPVAVWIHGGLSSPLCQWSKKDSFLRLVFRNRRLCTGFSLRYIVHAGRLGEGGCCGRETINLCWYQLSTRK